MSASPPPFASLHQCNPVPEGSAWQSWHQMQCARDHAAPSCIMPWAQQVLVEAQLTGLATTLVTKRYVPAILVALSCRLSLCMPARMHPRRLG